MNRLRSRIVRAKEADYQEERLHFLFGTELIFQNFATKSGEMASKFDKEQTYDCDTDNAAEESSESCDSSRSPSPEPTDDLRRGGPQAVSVFAALFILKGSF